MGMGIRGGGAAREIRAVLDVGAIGSLDDGDLLARFLGRDDLAEAAFAALVDRHGRMILRVCLDVLGDSHEAQDAAQATFFVLARKAQSIRKPDALSSWLHGTARRIATRALRDSIRRRRHERRSVELAETKPEADRVHRSWPELHEELDRLPGRYRDAIVLCDLAGLTHEQAAGKLGCPPRTLETRLYRGRERLKDRLARRGFAPSMALMGVPREALDQVPKLATWAGSMAGAAKDLAASSSWFSAEKVSAGAVGLAKSYLKGVAMFRWKVLLGSLLLVGAAWPLRPSQPIEARAQVGGASPSQTKPATPPPVVDPSPPKPYTHPIRVAGRALDPTGQPIPGARIYLAALRADYKRLAETTADAQGRYEFRDVPLPIEPKRATDFATRDYGVFQVFGEADGWGFAFRPQKFFHPRPLPSNITQEPDRLDPPAQYEATDPIQLDLRFPRTASLVGTIVDDRGNPLPGLRLDLRNCETGVLLDEKPKWSFDALNGKIVPDSMKLRTTDALGRFRFEGLPVDCRFRIDIAGQGFPSRTILAATADQSPLFYLGSPVMTGDLKITMATPVDVPIRMLYADTREPAAKVAVQASGMGVSVLRSSDVKGLAILRLPRGKYRMSNWPATGSPYLVTEGELEVGENPPAEPLVYTLRRAAILEVTVVDKATGARLAGVDLWVGGPEPGSRNRFQMPSWEEETRIAHQDSPRTDDRGKLRAFVEPGVSRFGIAREASPPWYVPDQRDGQEVECRGGQTTSITFPMRNTKKK